MMTSAEAERLEKAFVNNGASSVIESLLGDRTMTEETAVDRVNRVMRSLEGMAEHRIDAACCLMLSLWPIAAKLAMHHTCDGIALWIDYNRSARIEAYLRKVIESERDPGLRGYYEGLISVD